MSASLVVFTDLASKGLGKKESQLLQCLIEAAGSPVDRDVIRRRLWRDTKVSANAIDRRVFEVRSAIKEVKSQIEVSAIYGVGFRLERPLANNAKEKGGKVMANPADLLALVVDDVALNCDVVVELLRSLGVTADSAHDGKRAAEMAAKKSYDLIFMDCQMCAGAKCQSPEIIEIALRVEYSENNAKSPEWTEGR